MVIYVLAAFMIARFTQGFCTEPCRSRGRGYQLYFHLIRTGRSISRCPVIRKILCALIVSVTTSTMTARIKEQGQLQLEAEREKMRSNLLRAVSHDLRTPLTSILGASSAILENDSVLTAKERLTLLGEIHEDAEWLVGMVENLLTVTRVDGAVGANLNKVPEAAEEVVAEGFKFRKRFPNA
ncbi:MAG: sensor histidine kinase [Ruthenibacterium lactatiformans]